MKLFLSGLILTFSYLGHSAVLKECNTTIEFESKVLTLQMKVKSKNDKITGELISFGADMPIMQQVVPAKIKDYPIRENLPALVVMPELGFGKVLDPETLNHGERLIAHAIAMSDLGEEDTNQSTGIKLEDIRSARVFQFIEKDVNIGSTAIIEAYGVNHTPLGSFYGGFLIGACE